MSKKDNTILEAQAGEQAKAGIFEDRGLLVVTCPDGSLAGVLEQCDPLPWDFDPTGPVRCCFRISEEQWENMLYLLSKHVDALGPGCYGRVMSWDELLESIQVFRGYTYLVDSAVDALTMGRYPRLSLEPGSKEAEREIDLLGLERFQRFCLKVCLLGGPAKTASIVEGTGIPAQEVQECFEALMAKGYMTQRADKSFFFSHDGYLALVETKRLTRGSFDTSGFGEVWSDFAKFLASTP